MNVLMTRSPRLVPALLTGLGVLASAVACMNPPQPSEAGTPPAPPPFFTCRASGYQNVIIEPGDVAGRWNVTISGMKSGPSPRLAPYAYTARPEHWRIAVESCSPPGVTYPGVMSPFITTLDLTGATGTKGIELVSGDRSQKLAVPPAPGTPQTLLAGSSWELDIHVGDGTFKLGDTPVPLTTIITGRFDASSLSGSAGCNTYHAPYRTLGHTIAIGQITTTRMACAPDVAATEATFLQRLAASREFTRNYLANSLILGSLRFRSGPTTGASLVGSWKIGLDITHLYPPDVTQPVTREIPMEIRPDGSMTISWCDGFDARWAADVPTIRFVDIPSAGDACAELNEWLAGEFRALTAVLRDAALWRIVTGNQLLVYRADGSLLFRAHRQLLAAG
jgi:heat shock protein HslJ